MSKVMPLPQALRRYVEPGAHLHFSSTPSRSNAAIREVARMFRGHEPTFSLISASGFHSAAHLLVRLNLARQYFACFFGDNYPIPRPNPLYQQRAEEGATFHLLSLLSYVEALRAGALGLEGACVRSLLGTDLGRDLIRSGHYVEVEVGGNRTGLVKALRPDVTFVHAPLADRDGNVVVSQPSCEGYWAANGARSGVIVTVEKIVETSALEGFEDAMPIPRARVLAICPEPGGAHPQPLYADARFGGIGYPDDFDSYRLWRALATDDTLFANFERLVLDAPDGAEGYAAFREAARSGELPVPSAWREEFAKPGEITLVLAARAICRRVAAKGYRTIIAGIGQSYFAARLAKLWLEDNGVDVDVIIETGIVGVPAGADGSDFPLSYVNMERARRRTHVEHALGTLACGAANECLGVIGSAQVGADGSVNSTRVGGKLLVGPGGATDIAASAAEVVVLTRCLPNRMVQNVEHVTSAGHRVTQVVTELCTFAREASGQPWQLEELYPSWGGAPVKQALASVRDACPWPYGDSSVTSYTQGISTREMMSLHRLKASDETWTRETDSLQAHEETLRSLRT